MKFGDEKLITTTLGTNVFVDKEVQIYVLCNNYCKKKKWKKAY